MKYILTVTAFVFLCQLTYAQNINDSNSALQRKYLPVEINKLFIGMKVTQLHKLRPNAVLPTEEFDHNVIEKFKTGNVKEITYQINSDNTTVYEFIVEYRSTAKAIAIAKQMYKATNFASDNFPLRWKFELADGLKLVCYIFKNKICIIDNRESGFSE